MNKNFVVQIGIVVSDLKTAAKKWAEVLDMPVPTPSMTYPYERTHAQYQDKPCFARMYQVAFNFKNIQVELIQPIGEIPSIWRDCLNTYGNYIHHFAFESDDIQKSKQHFKSHGLDVLQEGDFPGGSYAYINSQNELGAIVELLSIDWATVKQREDVDKSASLFERIAPDAENGAINLTWDEYDNKVWEEKE